MSSPSTQPAAVAPASAVTIASVSETDLYCRLPLSLLFVSAAKWLVIAWLFELIASIKFHAPGFLADYAWLTYGRVHPAFTNSLIYGFCLQAGLGVILWLIAQSGVVRLVHPGLVTVGAVFWNLGVTLGIIGILAGDSTGFEHLEIPGYAALMLLIGYLLIGLVAVLTFHHRRERQVSAHHWFLFTALFWFPWIYCTANLLLVAFPVRGIDQAVIAWWYSQNLLVVWFAFVGLGAIFQLVPRLAGRPLHSNALAMFTYWVLILFAGWGGIPNSAPVPAWMPTLSTIATVLSSMAVLAVALNVCHTIDCSLAAARRNLPLAFLTASALAFTAAGFSRTACAMLDVNQTLHFTWLSRAISELNLYGFFVLALFGAIYVIMPRLMGVGHPHPGLARAHLWLSIAGVLLVVVPLAIGGVVEEFKVLDSSQPFVAVMRSSLMFLRVSTVGDLLLLAGHLLFLTNLSLLVVSFYRARAVATYAELTENLFKPAGARP